MGLFGNKKEAEKSSGDAPKAAAKVLPALAPIGRNLASVIKKPRITEKALRGIDQNVYTFEVAQDATKYDVRDAVKKLYGVTPVKVHMVKKSPRHYMSRMRGRDMMEKGMKKAYVYLKKDDRIDLA